MKCEKVQQWLRRDLDGVSEPSVEVAAHLERCGTCRAEAQRLRALAEMSRDALPKADVPADFTTHVMTSLFEPTADEALATAARPRVHLAGREVVGIEQVVVAIVDGGVIAAVLAQDELFEEPGDVGEVPLGRTDVGHGLHDGVLRRERLAKTRHDAARLEILFGQGHRRGRAVRFRTLRMATLELTRATPGSRVSSSLWIRSKSAMSATTTRSR